MGHLQLALSRKAHVTHGEDDQHQGEDDGSHEDVGRAQQGAEATQHREGRMAAHQARPWPQLAIRVQHPNERRHEPEIHPAMEHSADGRPHCNGR